MRMALGLAAISLLFAAGVIVVALGRVEERQGTDNFGDPVIVRPLSLRQDGKVIRLRAVRCDYASGGLSSGCGSGMYPLQAATDGFDPAMPFRLTFSSVGRVQAIAGVRGRERFRRVGRWEGTVQCIDSACVSSLRFPLPRDEYRPDPGPFPKRADTLRVIVYGDEILGADIAIEP